MTIPDAEKDKDLPKKLLQEAEGILAWLIEGCLEWQREGLGVPDVVQEATSTYREEMDSVTKFLSTQCEFAEGFKIPSSELFETYIEWCQGDRPDVKQLKNVLRERGLKNARSTGGRYVWHGIQLKPVESEPSQDKSEPSQDQSEGKSEHSEGSEPKKGNLFHESENLQELPKTSSLGSLVHSEVHYEYYQERAGKLEQAGKHRPLEPCPSCSTDNWYPHWQTAEKVWESGWAWGCATCNPGIVMEVH